MLLERKDAGSRKHNSLHQGTIKILLLSDRLSSMCKSLLLLLKIKQGSDYDLSNSLFDYAHLTLRIDNFHNILKGIECAQT